MLILFSFFFVAFVLKELRFLYIASVPRAYYYFNNVLYKADHSSGITPGLQISKRFSALVLVRLQSRVPRDAYEVPLDWIRLIVM